MNKKILPFILSIILVLSVSLPVLATNISPEVTRLAGNDRYLTASAIAKQGWNQSDYAILAYGGNFPDALGVAPLAKKYDAPILLTATNELQNNTEKTLKDLKVKNVIIVGGTGVISNNIESQLESMGISVERISGANRYETSVKIAQKLGSTNELIVATGEDYPDALSIAPIAAIKQIPIILVPREYIPDSVKDYISSKDIDKTYVIGSSEIISDNVCNLFPNSERITGADKYARNIAINEKFVDTFSSEGVCLATGEGFADAIAGSVFAAKTGNPILLIDSDKYFIHPDLVDYLNELNLSSVNPRITCFGGTSVVPVSIINNVIDFLTGKLSKDSILSIDNITASVNINDNYSLPNTVKAKLYNGTTKDVSVTWDKSTVNTSNSGTYKFLGLVEGYGNITLTLDILDYIVAADDVILTINKGDAISLPETVKGYFGTDDNFNAIYKDVPVVWSNPSALDPKKVGTTHQRISGTVKGYASRVRGPITVNLYLHVKLPSNSREVPIRLITNPKFPLPGTSGEIYCFTGVQKNSIGTPELRLSVENVSNKDIVAFEFTAKLYDSFDRPVYRVGTKNNTFKGIVQELISSGEESWEDPWGFFTWNLVLYDNTTKAKNIIITKVKYKDGSEWNL